MSSLAPPKQSRRAGRRFPIVSLSVCAVHCHLRTCHDVLQIADIPPQQERVEESELTSERLDVSDSLA